MSPVLERMERQAVLLDQPDPDPQLPGLEEILALAEEEQRQDWKPRAQRILINGRPVAGVGAGSFYAETLPPFGTADFATVTLLTTSLQMWPTSVFSSTPGGTYWWTGKKVRLEAFGKITTAATPGNLTIECRYGTTDAGGTLLATSAAQTLIAAQTNISWRLSVDVECRAVGTGTNGSLIATGDAYFGTAVIAVGDFLIPASAAAATGVDTTASSGLNIQFKRSGSTVETATTQKLLFWQLN